tara:strand:- start:59 stop:337 length:279 start_codon:yes stop_codon:yes gene_type:complete
MKEIQLNKRETIFINLLLVLYMTPLILSLYNYVNTEGTGQDIEHVHVIEPWYIWEDQECFHAAFKLARELQGPDYIFTWKGNDYTTKYKEEL